MPARYRRVEPLEIANLNNVWIGVLGYRNITRTQSRLDLGVLSIVTIILDVVVQHGSNVAILRADSHNKSLAGVDYVAITGLGVAPGSESHSCEQDQQQLPNHCAEAGGFLP